MNPAQPVPPDRQKPSEGRAIASIPASVVESEVRAITAQVDQARRILADAITKLGHSFGSLEKDTVGQKALMQSLLQTLTGPAIGSGADAGATTGIQQFIVETAKVLASFTDLLANVSGQSMKSVYRIDDMAKDLEGVSVLVAGIEDISEEAFVLGVNATIEAAHAGHAGRMFAVIASNIRELSKKTRKFNDDIATQTGKALATVKGVRAIMEQMASRDLVAALDAKAHVQTMLPQLENLNRVLKGSVDAATGTASRIAQSTSDAVTALQFEDILSQLLGGISKRAERIRAATCDDAADFAMAEAAAAELANPRAMDAVNQQNISAGEVELF